MVHLQGSVRRSTARPFERFRRAFAFHPALAAALLLACLLGLFAPPERSRLPIKKERTAHVRGWLSDLPEVHSEYLTLRLTVEEVRQGGITAPPLPGELLLYVSSSSLEPASFFDPPLQYGERVEFSSFIREPNYFATPGVPDYRLIASLEGSPFRAHLKSPLQLIRLGLSSDFRAILLRPVFSYLQAFQSECLKRLRPGPAEIVLSSFVGKKAFLERSEREAIREIGALHLFVVSGLHIGLLLAALHLLAGRALALALIWLYILAIGTPVSAVRAGIIATASYPLIFMGCRLHLLNLLGFSALLILLLSPGQLFTAGFQLSYLCILALGLGALPPARLVAALQRGIQNAGSAVLNAERDPHSALERRARFLLEERLGLFPRLLTATRLLCRIIEYPLLLLISSLAIQVFVLPLILHLQNRWNPVSLAANLLLIPLFTILIPVALLFFVSFWIPGSTLNARLLDTLGASSLHLIDWLEGHSVLFYFPHPSAGECALYFSALLLMIAFPPRRFRIGALALPLFFFSYLSHRSPAPPGELIVTMLDVDQGESIHLAYPDGSQGLIDTGGLAYQEPVTLVGERVVGRYLWNARVRPLDFVMITHPETDHCGGYPFLADAFNIEKTFFALPDPRYREPRHQLLAGRSFQLGRVHHEILHPAELSESAGKNDQSLVLLIRYGAFSMLFTGDIGVGVEQRIREQLSPVTVLKAGHHGSRYSSSGSFLDRLAPRLALMSAGRRNPFGHPSEAVFDRMRSRGILPFCTTTWGTLRLRTDGFLLVLEHYSTIGQAFVEILRERLVPGIPRKSRQTLSPGKSAATAAGSGPLPGSAPGS